MASLKPVRRGSSGWQQRHADLEAAGHGNGNYLRLRWFLVLALFLGTAVFCGLTVLRSSGTDRRQAESPAG